jgi:hypothetical protein
MRMIRAAAVLATLAVLFPAAGCIRYQEALVIMPDGSGKMTLNMGFNLEIFDKLKEMNPAGDQGKLDDEMTFDMDDVDNMEGIVALTRPKSEKKDGWQIWTVTAYFDDINKVKLKDKEGEEEKTKISYSFKKDGDGYVLEIDDKMFDNDDMKKADDVPEENQEQMWEMAKQFLKGFDVSRDVRMPGTVTTADGFAKKEGRTASNRVVEADIKSMADMMKGMKSAKRKIVCGKNDLSGGDVDAFKKEIDEAKAAWPKLKEEMKAEAEKKKKARADKEE